MVWGCSVWVIFFLKFIFAMVCRCKKRGLGDRLTIETIRSQVMRAGEGVRWGGGWCGGGGWSDAERCVLLGVGGVAVCMCVCGWRYVCVWGKEALAWGPPLSPCARAVGVLDSARGGGAAVVQGREDGM